MSNAGGRHVSELTCKTIYFKVLEHYWGEHIHMGGGLCFVPLNSSMARKIQTEMQVPFTICHLKVPTPLWTHKAAIGRRHWSLTKVVAYLDCCSRLMTLVAYHCTLLNSWRGRERTFCRNPVFQTSCNSLIPGRINSLLWHLVHGCAARTPSCLLYFAQHWAD